MNKNIITVVLLIVVAVAFYFVGAKNLLNFKNPIVQQQGNSQSLPNSFNARIFGDFTSSGATRNYESNLIFIDGSLSQGEISYISADINDKKINLKCVYKNNEWKDANSNGACQISSPSYNKESL